MRLLKQYLPILFMLVFIVAFQIYTQRTESTYYLTQMTMTAYYSLLVIGLCLLMGYAGQISLGHAGFFAIGGYTSAVLTRHNFNSFKDTALLQFLDKHGMLVSAEDMFGDMIVTFHPWIGFVVALFLVVIVAFIIGTPVLKLKGHYLAMATLGFGLIIYRVLLANGILGEADGISEVPGFPLFANLSISGDMGARTSNYYLAWGLLTLGVILLINLIHSRTGRALRAIHGSESAANAMGINTARYKLYIFVISAVFAAMAGIFLTHYNGGIGPSEAGVMKSVRYVALVAIGGMASLWGTLTIGSILNFLSLRGVFGSYDDAIFGSILIVIMLFAPHGILKFNLLSRMNALFRKLFPKAESTS